MMSFLSEQLRKHINSCEQIIRDITDFTITLIDDISQDNEELKQKLIKLLIDKITKSHIESEVNQ